MTAELTVTFAGSGDAFGSGGRFQTCIVVSDGSDTLLLDCGASSLTALKRLSIEPKAISHVALSHLHGDHFGGLPFLVLDGQFSRRENPLTVLGPMGTEERLTDAMETLFPGSSTVQRRFETRVQAVAPGLAYDGPGGSRLSFFPVDHTSGADAHAIRLQWHGVSLAYSGDTAWTPALADACAGTDLFICEAYFRDRKVPFHLSYSEIVEHRDSLDSRRIILTHMTNEMLTAEGIEFERAHDGLALKLPGFAGS